MPAPSHHPGSELLLDYAAGGLAAAPSLAVASHLSLCPHCRGALARLEAVGGALIEEIAPVSVADDALARIMDRLDEPEAPTPMAPPGRILPAPLRRLVGGDVEAIRWEPTIRGLDICELPVAGEAKARLLRVHAGTAMPQHTHDGEELTLVLCGAFRDETGRYARGDLAVTDSEIDHQPVAEPGEACICLAVTDAPLRLTGRFMRFLNPFVKF